MSQIAELILTSRTEGLLRGKKALEETTRAGAATEKAVGGTERGFVRAGRGAGQATPQIKGFNSAADQTRAMALAATRVLAGLATAFTSVRAVGQASQAYARIGNSLRAMGVEVSAVAGQIDAIGAIAQRTRSPLEATAQLYQRISIAGKDLGASQQDVLRFTENVGLALAQQGGSAAAASGALLQLSQAMAGGVVRAEEFNSILEGAFPIAQAAANAIDGAAGSVGKLRNMVIAGEVSSKEFFDAILSSSDALEAAFGNTVPTVAQAMSVLGTSFTLFVGSMDQAVGASALVAEGIIFLAENIDRIAAYAVTAAVVFGGAYVGGLVAANLATITLSGSLVFLRTALIRTGIGALIVGAGEVVLWFGKLVKSAGGFGKAMTLLGDVAGGVWEGMVDAAAAIPIGLSAVWQSVKAGFLLMISDMLDRWSSFLQSMASSIEGIEAFSGVYDSLQGSITNVIRSSGDFAEASMNASGAARDLKAEASALAGEGFGKAKAALDQLNGVMNSTSEVSGDTSTSVNKVNDAIDGTGKASKAAAKEAKKLADEIERLEFDADPLKKYNAEIAHLDELVAAGLSDGAYQKAVKDLNDEFANSNPTISKAGDAIGDFVAGGMRDFKSLLGAFKSMLFEMISTAISNPIKLALMGGVSGGSLAGTAAQAAGGGAAGGGGILSGIGSALGGIGSALTGGFGLAASGLMSGGIGGMLSAIGGQLGVATTSITAFAGAVGALALPLLAVGAVFSFFKKKVTELDSGLRVTADNVGTFVESFRTLETKRFWGLSKKVSTNYTPLEAGNEVEKAVDAIRSSIAEIGATMGLTADNFASFSIQIEASLKGLDEAARNAEIQRIFDEIGEQFSYAALGWFDENTFGGVIREGETATATLINLATSLDLINSTFDELNYAIFDASIVGAKAARDFADAFGGFEGFARGVSSYVDTFYSDGEKLEIVTKRIQAALEGINTNNVNTAMDSRANFKALTDWAGSGAAVDPSQANLFAKLINAAPLIDQMFKLQEQIDAAGQTAGETSTDIEAVNTALREREGLERQLLTLQGDTVGLRAMDLAALDPSNRALLTQIHLLEDQAVAAQAAAAIATTRAALEREILQLNGDTNAIRALELAALDESLRPLQQQIYALKDQATAADEAAVAAQRLADAERAITDERLGLEKQLMEVQGDTAGLRALELAALDPSNRALQERIWAIETETDLAAKAAAAQEAILSERASLEDRLLSAMGETDAIRARELAGVDASNRAILAQIYAIEDATTAREAEQRAIEDAQQKMLEIASERAGLERQLLEVQGDTVAIRQLELAALDPSNHALQQRIWNIQDENELLAAQAAIADERLGLERRMLELNGDTAAIRALELAAVDPANRALLASVFAREDEIDAINKAAEAATEAARIATETAEQRYGLESRLLEVQGDTAALRVRELDALFPANRALQERIWGIEAENAAIEEANRIASETASERYGLETQLLTLQGDTAALRSRELDLLFPANRALQERIWALEDAAAAETDAVEVITASADKMRAAFGVLEGLISNAIDKIEETARVQIEALQSTLDAAQASFDATSDAFQRAYDVVQASISAERAIGVARYEASISSLDARIQSATQNVDGLRGVFDLLDGALSGRVLENRAIQMRQLAAAQSFLQGQNGAIPADQDRLAKALDLAGGDNTQFYTNATDYARDFLKTSAAIAKMRDTAETQLTDGERTIAVLEATKSAREGQHAAFMASLDAQAAKAEEVYQTALGNVVAVMAVDASINDLSRIALQFTAEQIALQELTDRTNAQISILESEAKAQVAILNEQLVTARTQVEIAEGTYNATLSITEAIDDLSREIGLFLASTASVSAASVPAFANGGTHRGGLARVGESDMELVAPSRIYSGSETRAMLDNGPVVDTLKEVLRELAQMRDENTQLAKQLVLTNKKMADLAKKHDIQGTPPVRETT